MWILGSSIIKNAWIQALNRPGGANLALERCGINIWWQGYSGLKLGKLKSKVRTLSAIEEMPDILVLHCGGNDIGQTPIGDLRSFVKTQLRSIHKAFPSTKIVWSQILPRKQWRYSQNLKAMESCRKRLNSAAAAEAVRLNGGYIRYPDLVLSCDTLWSDDGVHLSSIGNEILLNTIQNALENFVIKK